MYIGLHVECQLFLSHFNEIGNYSTNFRKNKQTSKFMNIRPVGPELLHVADGQRDRQRRSEGRTDGCQKQGK